MNGQPNGATVNVPALPTEDEYVASLLRTEQLLADAFETLSPHSKRQVIAEIEGRQRVRQLTTPGGLRILFPSLAPRKH